MQTTTEFEIRRSKMIEKNRAYEIVGTLTNKKEREAIGRVLDELYANYESGQTLKATKNKQVRRLVNIYLDADFGEIAQVKRSKPHSREGGKAGEIYSTSSVRHGP